MGRNPARVPLVAGRTAKFAARRAAAVVEGVPPGRMWRDAGEEIDRWIQDPLYWARQVMGEGFDPWSGQEALWRAYGRILNAKLKRLQIGAGSLTPEERADADKMGISVMAGHGLGKERTVAGIALHYLTVLKGYQPKVVCTAPAGPTLHSTLWPELGKVIAGSPVLRELVEKQANRIYLKEDRRRGEFMRIEPRTIQVNSNPDEQGVVLAGIHATGVLYVITEASGVPEPVFKPIEGGLTDPLSLIVMIFNPTRRAGFAYDSHTVNRARWVCVQWDGRALKQEKAEQPGRFAWFNERAQDALIEKYGPESDTVRIRVYGMPPNQSADTLIPYEAALEATGRVVRLEAWDPVCVFVDVGGDGEDPSVVTVLRGPRVMRQVCLRKQDTVQVADAVAGVIAAEAMSVEPGVQVAVGVDTIGLGRGVYDQLWHVHQVRGLYRLDVSEQPMAPERFHRLRDQVWWELREGLVEQRELSLLSEGLGGRELEELVAELTTIRWAEVGGKIKVQGKGSASGIPHVRPLAKSPNRGDSLAGAWWLYRHAVSRVPVGMRRLRLARRRVVSWKAV